MKPETLEKIKKEAEEKYPGTGTYAMDQILGTALAEREAYIAGSTPWAEKVEELNALINSPEIEDFLKGVQIEQAHQIERWGTQDDLPPEHFILVANKLMGKLAVSIFDNDLDKFKHHSITLAAVMSQVHRLLKLDWYVAIYFKEDG